MQTSASQIAEGVAVADRAVLPSMPPLSRIHSILGKNVTMHDGAVKQIVAQLEALLLEAPGGSGRRVEVLNFGMAGRDAVATVERLHEKALAYDPDVVVFGWTLNDLENAHYRRVSVPLHLAAVGTSRSYLWRIVSPRISSSLVGVRVAASASTPMQ